MVTLLLWLAANAVVVAALTPAVWLLCRHLRSRPAVQHLLWFLLFLKLVAPPVLYWPWSIDLSAPSLTAEARTTAPTRPGVAHWLDDEHPFDLASEPAIAETIAKPLATGNVTAASFDPQLSIDSLAVVCWAAGAVVLVAFIVRGLWRQRQILRSTIAPPEHLLATVRQIAAQFGLRPPKVAVSDRISTPAICCLGAPRLIWPATMTAKHVVADCHGVVAHELAHLARRDHYFLYAELVVTVCCWWNPLMWIIRRRLCETRELACDARALAAVEQPRCNYAQRLLNLSVSRPDSLLIAPAFGAGNMSRRFLKRRLIMVFDERVHGRTSLGGFLLAIALVALALPGFTLAEAPADSDAAGPPASSPTVTASPSSSSSSTSDATASSSSADESGTITGRSLRLSKVIKNDEISADKSAEISLGSGGTIRISKNDQGDLVVTVEQSEVSLEPRRRRVVMNRTVTAEPGLESGRATVTASRVIRSNSSPASGTVARSFEASGPDLDREMLQSEVELAEINLAEQRAKLGIAKQQNVDEGHRQLAELAVRRAEIELRRAKLRLSHGESIRPRR